MLYLVFDVIHTYMYAISGKNYPFKLSNKHIINIYQLGMVSNFRIEKLVFETGAVYILIIEHISIFRMVSYDMILICWMKAV